jgi:hypothetical protein
MYSIRTSTETWQGGVTPNLETLRRIAEALGLELIVDLRRARRSA